MKIKDKNAFTLFVFTIWFIIGLIYYSIKNELGWGQGFYMAVNMGYSIGYGYPLEIDDQAMVFSIFFLLIGRVMFIFAIYSLTEDFFQNSKSWYAQVEREELEERSSYIRRFYMLMQDNFRTIAAILIFFAMLIGCTSWSCDTFGINITNGAYLALSIFSTCGQSNIPHQVKY